MKIDVYTSTVSAGKHLSVPSGTNLAATPFPPTLDPDLRTVYPAKTALDIQPGDHRIAMDSRDIIDQINQKGFATHSSTITVTVTTQ
jgi:hypothetical protein